MVVGGGGAGIGITALISMLLAGSGAAEDCNCFYFEDFGGEIIYIDDDGGDIYTLSNGDTPSSMNIGANIWWEVHGGDGAVGVTLLYKSVPMDNHNVINDLEGWKWKTLPNPNNPTTNEIFQRASVYEYRLDNIIPDREIWIKAKAVEKEGDNDEIQKIFRLATIDSIP